MTMRLELKQIRGTAQSGPAPRWQFERGRRTLGRSSDCDWQIPDTTRSVSKLHCTIERDRKGFLLRDESANGTKVDGVLVLEGETARLTNRSQLECGTFTFSVAITGEKDLDIEDPHAGLALSDESLTISAILADIAPGGRTATGILGERDLHDWPSTSASTRSNRKDEAVPSSRNVEIGWSGPPAINGMQPLLPNDWNEDFDYGNRLEHAAAPQVSVPVAKSRNKGQTAENPERSASVLIYDENGETHFTAPQKPSPDTMSHIEALLDRCEEASRAGFAILDIDPEILGDTPDLFGARREDMVVARLEAALARQSLLNTALDGLLREASHAMEPRIIEARVDTEQRRLPWRSGSSYWQAYRQQFDDNGTSLSVHEFLRKAMLRALGKTEDDGAGTTGKVKRTS